MGRAKSPPSRCETGVCWAIIAVLGVIAVGVFIKQFDYDPALFVPSGPQSLAPQDLALAPMALPDLSDFLPADMTVLSPMESFGAEDLFEKINGKAELYLSAGFLSLRSQRFAIRVAPQSWVEVFVYDMGSTRRAFAVYSAQRRAEAKLLDLAHFSYGTANALFLAYGRYYVEIVSSGLSEAIMDSMLSFAKNFVSKVRVDEDAIHEIELFPQKHLREESTTFYVSGAFGFDGFENVFAASYHIKGEELTAFLSQQKSAKEAARLVQAYHTFLLENGGTDVSVTPDLAGAVLVEILGAFELVFPHGQYAAGVHEAETQAAAERLAMMLAERLAMMLKERLDGAQR